MTTTEREFVHIYELDADLVAEIGKAGVSLEEIAEIVERSALGADIVTPNDTVSSPLSLLVEQYALLLSDADLTKNISDSLTKFRAWLFKFSPELAKF